MAVDVLVKYKNFPALEIELDNNSLKHDYKNLLKKNSQQPPISRDPCKYTLEYFSVLAQQAKDILKWDWVRTHYSLKELGRGQPFSILTSNKKTYSFRFGNSKLLFMTK